MTAAGVVEQTTGTCPVCGRLAPVRVEVADGHLVFRSWCPTHGERSRTVADDADAWLDTRRHLRPALLPADFRGDATLPCPDGCGFCTRHEQHLCLPIVEITDACDLACPVCLADAGGSWFLSPSTFGAALDRVLVAERQIDILNLSGGEPLLHPQILTMIDTALARPEVVKLSISTNGRPLLDRPELLTACRERGVTISLQCDGFDDEAYRLLRGRPLADEKRRLLDLLGEHDCSTSLTMTVARHCNEREVRPLLDLLFDREHIVSLMLQPLACAGRAAVLDRERHRLDIPACLDLLAAADHPDVSAADFTPLPCCHPHCFALAYYLPAGSRSVPVKRLLADAELQDLLANRTMFGLDPEEHRRLTDLVYELWGRSVGDAELERLLARLRDVLRQSCACAFDPRSVFALGERHAKSIFIHAFQDAWTFDLSRVRRCCNAYLQPDGSLRPACVHNVLGGRREGDDG